MMKGVSIKLRKFSIGKAETQILRNFEKFPDVQIPHFFRNLINNAFLKILLPNLSVLTSFSQMF